MLRKIVSIVLMIVAPVISGKAFYEYVGVKYLEHKPSYPFGKELMKTIQTNDIQYLSSYQDQLLTIGIVFLGISIIVYVSTLIKAMINLIWLAAFATVAYFVYAYVR